jgi:SH3-like domain-containing protein
MMQKKLVALMVAVVMLTTVAVAALAEVGNLTMYVYTANGKTLNLRESPTTSSRVLANIPYGAAVRVFQPYSSSWYSIQYNGINGYVMSKFLVSNPPGPKPHPSPTASPSEGLSNAMFNGFTSTYYQAEVRPSSPSGYVNLRWAPSLHADIHSRYYLNDLLIIMSQNNSWCQVLDQKNNVMGFMMRSFLAEYQGDGVYGSEHN